MSGGWRSGKSVVAAAEATPHLLIPSPRSYLGALIGPTYKEPREEFDYIVEFLSNALPTHQFNFEKDVSRPKDGPCELTIRSQRSDGQLVHFGTVRTYTAAEAEAIRGFNADFVIVCEVGGISEAAFESIIGRTLSTGGFIFGSGTLESSQKWYHDRIKSGQMPGATHRSFIMPSWTNLTAFPDGREDEKIKRVEALLDPETFAIRVGAEPIRISGVALRQLSKDHVEDVIFDPSLPVELAIDPGYTGAYSVLAIQQYGNQIRIIDEVYERFLGTDDIIEKCRERPWWSSVDTDNPGVIDRAAKQKSSVTGDSVLDMWMQKAELWLDLTEAVIPVEDGLAQARIHLNIPNRIRVSPNCKGLLAECDLGEFPVGFERAQPWHYKTGTDGELRGDKALSGADHSCTAFIYWLIHRFGYMTTDDIDKLGFSPTRILPRQGKYELEDQDYGPVGSLGSVR